MKIYLFDKKIMIKIIYVSSVPLLLLINIDIALFFEITQRAVEYYIHSDVLYNVLSNIQLRHSV